MTSYTKPISQHVPPAVVTVLKTLRGSFLLFVMAVGLACILMGLLLQYVLGKGVLAGMFGVWGISALLAGGVAYLVLLYIQ
jgi:hypothetical protein